MIKRVGPIAINIIYVLSLLFLLGIFFVNPASTEMVYYTSEIKSSNHSDVSHLYADTTRYTYAQFESIKNRMETDRKHQQRLNEGGYKSGWSYAAVLGSMRVDTAYDPRGRGSSEEKNVYYLTLGNYKLDQYSEFNVRDGRYWLTYTVWDTTTNQTKRGHAEEREIFQRFAYDNADATAHNRKGRILVPVGKKTYDYLVQPLGVLFIMLMFATIYVLIVLPSKLLWRISRGEVFTRRHVRHLTLISIVLLAFPVLTVLLQLVLRLAFHNFIPDEVSMDFSETLIEGRYWLLGSVVFFAISKSFKRGLNLQNEQDLTV